MALQIIDRRLAGKNKSVGNRERFVRRFKEQIAEAVRRAVSQRDIRHIEQAENVTIPKKDIREPVFRHGPGGVRDTVHPGNVEHVRGDRIPRPQGGAGGAGSQASDSGEGEDDFTFTLSKEEFMELFFEDLALPRLLRTHLGDALQYKTRRAGYSHDGTPHNLAVLRTMRGALGRRMALTKAPHRELQALLAVPDAKVLIHGEELGDRLSGIIAGYLVWTGLVPSGPKAISLTERLLHRQLGPPARELVTVAMELAGHAPLLVEGAEDNIKVTTAADFALAEFLLARTA